MKNCSKSVPTGTEVKDRTASSTPNLETIVARSSPDGKGAISVIRLSGPDAKRILTELVTKKKRRIFFRPRVLCHGWILDEEQHVIDEVMAVFLPGPASYTGEDVAEIFGHGGRAVVAATIEQAIKRGARPALPGEFSKRALEAGKMDLSQAEGIIRMIEAGSRKELHGAARVINGEIKERLSKIRKHLVEVMAWMEACIDFSEEPDVGQHVFLDLDLMVKEIEELNASLTSRQTGPMEVVVAGAPNVGKSSLVNALSGQDVSIVTQEAGTTRDAVVVPVVLGGVLVHLVDTAGQGDLGNERTSLADQEAMNRAKSRMKQAELILWITDDPKQLLVPSWINPEAILVVNKSDLLSNKEKGEVQQEISQKRGHLVCAKNQEGIRELADSIGNAIELKFGPADGMPVTLRQSAAAKDMLQGVLCANAALKNRQLEIAMVELKKTKTGLEQLSGEGVGEEILNRIFDAFCIGK